jgi:hypothetical protein
MKPTTNPPDTAELTAGTCCDCPGDCGLTHDGPCAAKHLHRFPGTRTTVHLETTPAGFRCPYCLLAATRPNAISERTAAALRRPGAAEAAQDDLFDVTPYQRPATTAGGAA